MTSGVLYGYHLDLQEAYKSPGIGLLLEHTTPGTSETGHE